jgi:hypothetical protein
MFPAHGPLINLLACARIAEDTKVDATRKKMDK